MRVQQSVIQKIFHNPLNTGSLRSVPVNRSVTGARDFRGWIRNIISLKRPGSEPAVLGSSDIEIANREVHLDGYATHEEVVRAYLAFAGIDPDSKEARLYFEL